MSQSATSTAVHNWHSFPWPGRAFWVPLLAVVANLAFFIAWPHVERTVSGLFARPWVWRGNLLDCLQGWTMGCLPLAAIWLCFAAARPAIRFAAVTAAVSAGVLAYLSGLGFFWNFDFFRTYYLPQLPSVYLVAIQLIAALHLALYPLRRFLHWRLDFLPSPACSAAAHRFQFTLRDVLWLTIASAIALAAIRAANVWLSRAGRNDILFMPTVLRLMSFGQILVPSLACAWLIVGGKRQWIGGLVLALALACPAVLIYSGWYITLSLSVRELWWAHWTNVGAVACVGLNLLALRLCGLRGVVISVRPER